MKNKRILLTGGAGFIGSSLCKSLSEENEIIIYDNLQRNSLNNIGILKNSNLKLVIGDILDTVKLKEVVAGFNPQIVVHMAAVAGIDTVIKSPIKTMTVNMMGTYNILSAIEEHTDQLERFLDFSTSEVFGTYAYKVDEESTTNLAPVGEARWTYSVSKLAGEHLAHSYYIEQGMPVVVIRPFNIYGPGQVGEGAIHTFVDRAIRNQAIQVHGDGDQIRSWCYIDDFIEGVLLCMEKEEAVGCTFNIGNPKGTVTISMLAQLIKTLAESSSTIEYIPKNYVDIELRMPSIERARKILDYQPKYDLTQGLIETIKWYKKKLGC